MENRIPRKYLWDSAGKAGLVLGLVSSAYVLITHFITGLESSTGMAFFGVLLSFLLWGAKFAGCILLMKFFMKKYAQAHPGCDNSDTFRFGMVTALLSALIFAAFDMAFLTWIAPDTFEQALAAYREGFESGYRAIMTEESIEAMENMNFGMISFFSNLIYCFLFGTVLARILSRNIPSSNPFAGYQQNNDTPEEQ